MELALLVLLSTTLATQNAQLEGKQHCSYRPMEEIYGLYTYEKLELDKGRECTVCSSSAECRRFSERLTELPSPEKAITGHEDPVHVPETHFVLGTSLKGPWATGIESAIFGMGCFWGVEGLFWSQPGVYSTQVGYAGGYTLNPTYEEVCSGYTGHVEVVRVQFDPREIPYESLLKLFWEKHDPTQGMKRGTQYRSVIMVSGMKQRETAERSRTVYQKELFKAGLPPVTTEIRPVSEFYYAEEYHQQYVGKNPGGFCGLGGTGVEYPLKS